LEKVRQVFFEGCDIEFILILLFKVERDDLKLVKVLQPAKVVVGLNEPHLPELFQITEGHVVSMEVKVFSVAFLPREHLVSLFKYFFHLLGE